MKVSLYKLSFGCGRFYYGTTTQSLRQRYNEHKSFNRWKIEDWVSSKIELLEEFECESKRERERREDLVLKEYIGNPLCLNLRRAFVTKEESREVNKKVCKKYNEEHKDELREKAKIRNAKRSKCDKCGVEVSNPNLSRHTKQCSQMKVSRSTGERNVYRTECGRFQLQITTKGKAFRKNYDTLEEAVAVRNERRGKGESESEVMIPTV